MGVAFETIKPSSTSTGEFPIGQEQLASISRDHDTTALQQYGGVAGISNLLKTHLEKGIHGDDVDLLKQRNSFGSNNYPRKKGIGFLMFMWDACKDLTLVILMVAAATSLALGIKSEVIPHWQLIQLFFYVSFALKVPLALQKILLPREEHSSCFGKGF